MGFARYIRREVVQFPAYILFSIPILYPGTGGNLPRLVGLMTRGIASRREALFEFIILLNDETLK